MDVPKRNRTNSRNPPPSSSGMVTPAKNVANGGSKETDPSLTLKVPKRKKRPYPTYDSVMSNGHGGGSSSSASSPSSLSSSVSSSLAEDSEDFLDLICPICMEMMKEPTVTFCGHSYCRTCITETIESGGGRCPKCGMIATKAKICPNFAMADLISRLSRTRGLNAVKAQILESMDKPATSFDDALPTNLVALVSSANYQELNLSEVNKLLMILQTRKDTLTMDEEHYKRQLLREFLTKLLEIKKSQLEQLNQEIAVIYQDISALKTDNDMWDLGGMTAGEEVNILERSAPAASSSAGRGFNTQPVRQLEQEEQSISYRKRRMYKYFDELSQVYFETRNSLDNSRKTGDDATVPLTGGRRDSCSELEDRIVEGIGSFGRTLTHVTRYHDLKPLATLTHSEDALSANANIISSIEFDKDSEFFAVAGVTKQIKLFEYLNVIGNTVDFQCPTTTLDCKVKISCLGWSPYFKNHLASSDYDGGVSLWDVARYERIRNFAEHERRVWSVDWCDGNPSLLASGSDDSKVKVWSTNIDRSVVNLDAKVNVCSVKFCPDSAYEIIFGSADHCIHHYDLRKPNMPLGILSGHKKAVSYVKFVGKRQLVSASTDSHLKLWDLNENAYNMNCTRDFSGHVNDKNFVGLATEGNYIACGSEDNSVYVYYKLLPTPLFSFKFQNLKSLFAPPKVDEASDFVSAVAWKKGSPVVIAANSNGTIKVLQLV